MLLQSAAEGNHIDYLTLAEEMEERDPHYSSVLRTRKLAVSGLPVHVIAADDSKQSAKMADDIRQLIDDPAYDDLANNALDAIGKGYSVNEIMWDTSGALWRPQEYRWRDPRHFIPDRNSPDTLRLLDEADRVSGVQLPPYKFVVHRPKLKSGIALRGGLARVVALSYVCKMYGIKDWLAYMEVYGMPLRIGRYPSSANEDDKRILKMAVASIGSDAAAILPDSMMIEFQDVSSAHGGADVFARLVEWIDKQVSKAVLGQTASTEGTVGRLGSDKAQDEVRQDLILADAKQLAATINRDLVRPYIDLNYGQQSVYPRIHITIPEQDDLDALADNLSKLVPLGLRVSATEIRNKLGLSDPSADDEILTSGVAATAVNARMSSGVAINRATPEEQDDIDSLVEASLGGWQRQINPVIDPVLDAIKSASSYDEIAKLLPTMLDRIDNKELVQAIATACLKAYGDGIEGAK
jgi:phage gp29-like protein